jgi:quercetin dioxygenase-like cupin family protein
MTITVLDVAGAPLVREGDAEVAHFLNAQTVGARTVEGTAYRLLAGATLAPMQEAERYQIFYVTAGEPIAVYNGERHELARGRGVYCDPGEACAFENPGSADAAFYRFVIDADQG